MIVVMPDGGAMGWYTDWYAGDRPVQPRWETYHVGELVPWIDATYRTIAARRGRAIAGLSMGGFGALSYAARHPGTFAAAASFSGALEVGSSDAWGPRSANRRAGARTCRSRSRSGCGRWRHRARTGNGRPGPLDRRGTKPNCPGCALERYLHGRQRAPARAAAGARHPPRLGRLRPGHARLALLAPRPARDAPRPRTRARSRLRAERPD
jgi:pimeloyl-ACP methyl ester carboxylesterase